MNYVRLINNLVGTHYKDQAVDCRWTEMIDGWFKCVSKRKESVLKLRYEQGKSYAEIGKQLAVTRERARQIICSGLRDMRKVIKIRRRYPNP